ncbi:MAG: Nif3-like dinuclear metal center hexameric protein [Niabella sp.]
MALIAIAAITEFLESIAPPSIQESYDNSGLLTGQHAWPCSGVLCCLDVTEAVVDDAIKNNCNLIVAHHPIIFSGLKKITGSNYVERTIIKAIKNDIAIYAIHTNLDNVIDGVNGMMAAKLGLQNISILAPQKGLLKKLFFYVPAQNAPEVMNAIFETGGGSIGNYSECSFSVNGTGTFKPNEKATPFIGQIGKREEADELKIEILFPNYLEAKIINNLKQNHPYEEVAYEVITIDNRHQYIGSGVIGELSEPISEKDFLTILKSRFQLKMLKHTRFTGNPIKKVALCGGAGSFLTKDAINLKSDIYISSDIKYHEFFEADNKILLADIGHYESEQFTIELLVTQLEQKFPNFAVLKTVVNTNPVHYF